MTVYKYLNQDTTEEITLAFLGSSKTVLGFLYGESNFIRLKTNNLKIKESQTSLSIFSLLFISLVSFEITSSTIVGCPQGIYSQHFSTLIPGAAGGLDFLFHLLTSGPETLSNDSFLAETSRRVADCTQVFISLRTSRQARQIENRKPVTVIPEGV